MSYRVRRIGGLLDDAGGTLATLNTGIASMQADSASISTDVHAMRESVDLWLKIIGGSLLGIGAVLLVGQFLRK